MRGPRPGTIFISYTSGTMQTSARVGNTVPVQKALSSSCPYIALLVLIRDSKVCSSAWRAVNVDSDGGRGGDRGGERMSPECMLISKGWIVELISSVICI